MLGLCLYGGMKKVPGYARNTTGNGSSALVMPCHPEPFDFARYARCAQDDKK
jgi:hypothetical protein